MQEHTPCVGVANEAGVGLGGVHGHDGALVSIH